MNWKKIRNIYVYFLFERRISPPREPSATIIPISNNKKAEIMLLYGTALKSELFIQWDALLSAVSFLKYLKKQIDKRHSVLTLWEIPVNIKICYLKSYIPLIKSVLLKFVDTVIEKLEVGRFFGKRPWERRL